MKNQNPNHGLTFNAVVKYVGEAFKSLFQSNHNRDFRRLKDFIAG